MQKTEDHILVIFGASGDLTRRKLIPALAELLKLELLPDRFAVLGIGRSKYDDISYRDMISGHIEDQSGILPLLHYHTMDPEDVDSYNDLADRLGELTNGLQIPPNYIFYLATPPSLYGIVPRMLTAAGLTQEGEDNWKRIIIEKPFGKDYPSALELNRTLLSCLSEHQVYRIDHYLGKETVQNVLVTRFSNGIFEPLWNRNFIHHVEITASESLGVGTRGGYYDPSGALRDMLQNHLLQLLGLVAMEPPTVISSDAIRNEVLKVFQSLRPITGKQVAKQVIRGQYMDSQVRGEAMPGYRSEKGVPEESRTETFVAMKLFIDNWRWGGVPFYLRTGKRLPTRVTEIVVHFKPSPHSLFSQQEGITVRGNYLVIRVQPDEGILLKFGMKVPGAGFKVQEANMDFHYKDLIDSYIPESYQRLLLDCMQGDSTLYARGDAVEAAWRFVDPILKIWAENHNIPLHGYPCGTWGPEVADQLIEGEDYTWRYPCKNLTDDGLYCEL
jgi:glucose-6-phosphate 1-dehydrogenase